MLRSSVAAVLTLVTFLVINGCGSSSTAVSSTPTPGSAYITVSASALTFSSTTINTTSAAQTITVTNTGTVAATLTSDSITGANPTAFTLSAGTCGTTLAAGASCTISVTFTPTAAITYAAAVTITDNATNSPQSITLSGTGVAVPVPVANVSPSSLTYTGATALTPTADQYVTIANNGSGPLTISSIAFTGSGYADFAIDTNNCPASPATLAPTANCVLGISFTPYSAYALYTATLTITDNTNNVVGSTQTVALSGTSLAPASLAQAVLSPISLTFPATTQGIAATSQVVTLSNPGTATLTGLSAAVTGGATATSFSIVSTTCGTTLNAGSNCTYTIGFTPSITGTFLAYLTVTDVATNSPQVVTLNGIGQVAPAPIAAVAPTALNFQTTLPGSTSASASATLTNTGSATLNISGIAFAGNTADFTQSNTCGATLAVNASCTFTTTFAPQAATTYSATITITDNSNNVANSTQVITLSGTGGTFTTYRTLVVLPSDGTDASMPALYALINGAQKSIDMTMYEMQDTTFLNDLLARCQAGVVVRVIFSSSVASSSASSLTALNAQKNCSAVDSNPSFTNTHQKTITVDNTTTAILSLNLQQQYYTTTRDYGIITNDQADIAAIEATFAQDYAAGAASNPSKNPTEFAYQPPPGDDLVWSPTTATADMLAIINNATKTLYIECEELTATNIISAISAAATRGVATTVICENESNANTTGLSSIKSAGGAAYYYSSSTGFYIHAKAVVADLGLQTEALYIGSINYSSASLTANRELGVYITGNTTVSHPLASIVQNLMIGDESGSGVTKF